MKQFTNALSNEVWLYRNRIVKKYSKDEFKDNYGNQELQALTNQGISATYDKEKNEMYIQYFEGESFNDNKTCNECIIAVADALKDLHKVSTEGIKLSTFKKAYDNLLSKHQYGLKELPMSELETKYVNEALTILESGEQVLLHNDVVQGNLLKVKNGIRLIDFEYSGLGNPIFDIASFLTERELSKEHYDLFVSQFEGVNKEELKIVSCFLQLFWARWALYKFELTKKDIYKEIADWKIEQYELIK